MATSALLSPQPQEMMSNRECTLKLNSEPCNNLQVWQVCQSNMSNPCRVTINSILSSNLVRNPNTVGLLQVVHLLQTLCLSCSSS